MVVTLFPLSPYPRCTPHLAAPRCTPLPPPPLQPPAPRCTSLHPAAPRTRALLPAPAEVVACGWRQSLLSKQEAMQMSIAAL